MTRLRRLWLTLALLWHRPRPSVGVLPAFGPWRFHAPLCDVSDTDMRAWLSGGAS